MGSYDVACGLSNLPIHSGDRAGIILMKASGQAVETQFPTAYLHATDLFLPYLPPIYGTYNDYGRLTDVVPSITTKLLEDSLRKPIETILECVGNEDRDLYDVHGPLYKHYMIHSNKLNDYHASVTEKLLSVGFTMLTEKSYQFSDFILSLAHSGYFEIFKVGSEHLPQPRMGRLFHIFSGEATFDGGDSESLLSFFSETTALFPGYLPEEYKAIRTLLCLRGMFFLQEVSEGMLTHLRQRNSQSNLLKDQLAQYFSFLDEMEQPLDAESVLASSTTYYQAQRYLANSTSFDSDFSAISLLGYYADSDEYFALLDFMDVLSSTNHLLMPSYCGEQFGDDDASAMLHKIVGNVVKTRNAVDAWTEITVDNVLDAPLSVNDSGAKTIRGYLLTLGKRVVTEQEGFSGKRPFGNSGWTSDLFRPLSDEGYEEAEAEVLIVDAVNKEII